MSAPRPHVEGPGERVGASPADAPERSGEAAPSVTATVLNYDGRQLLETLLPSLQAQSFGDVEIVVVDNGSRDDSRAWLAANWPRARVVALPENVGVTRALNECLRAATGEYVFLLNNDIELAPTCLEELAGALAALPQAAVAVPKLLEFHRRQVIDGAGDVYTWGGEAHRRGKGEFDHGQYDVPAVVFSACGGAALYRRSVVEEVGGFDERFFANGEDTDWSFRAQLAGHPCHYVPSAVAYHVGSATLGAALSDFGLYHNWRNSIWVVAKNYPACALVRYGPRLLGVQVRNLGIAARRGKLRVWLRVWRDALRGLPGVLRDRKRVQRSRRLSQAELDALIEPRR
jgi:GT2 family glycosyltransferase